MNTYFYPIILLLVVCKFCQNYYFQKIAPYSLNRNANQCNRKLLAINL